VPLVLFYFLKLKRPRKDIPSLFLWRQVINDSRVNAPFQRFKRNLLLLLQILLLVLLALAALQPFFHGEEAGAKRLPVLIDTSASMGALDKPGGVTRLEAAKEKVSELIEGLLPDQELCIVTFGGNAKKRTGFTNNKRILREAVDAIDVEDVSSDLEDALRMTQALARSVSFSEVLLLSDGNFPAKAEVELPFQLDYHRLPPGGANAGITSLNARRAGDGTWNVFVLVEGTGEVSSEATVELLSEGEIIGTEYVSAGKDKPQRIVFRLPGEKALSLMVRLKHDSFDSLASDDAAFLHLPAVRSVWVYAPASMASYRSALESLNGITLFPDGGSEEESCDLLISDRPEDLNKEAQVRFFVGIVPEDVGGLVEITGEGTEVVDWRRTSPLLQHVEMADLVILDEPRFREGIREGDVENLGYEALVYGRRGPLLLEHRLGDKLSFYLLFHSDRSTLPYRVGFPVLVANLVDMTMHQAGIAEAQGKHTGVLPGINLLPGQLYTIESPDGSEREMRSDADGVLAGIPAPVSGCYVVRSGGTTLSTMGASLLSSSETALEGVDKIQFSELSVAAVTQPVKAERSLWYMLAAMAFGVLLVEWWYSHRRP
jgi:Ca-activated chloride channel family protein